jgi:DDE superfamily endonuclease
MPGTSAPSHHVTPSRQRSSIMHGTLCLPSSVGGAQIGDQTYSVLALGHACTRRGVRLIAPLRLDAALYEPAPPRAPGTNRRPRIKGKRAPTLAQMLRDAHTTWQRLRVRWYDGRWRVLAGTSGTAVWYRVGQPVLPLRWVLVRDPTGQHDPRAYFSTHPSARARDIVGACIKRWTIETTVEESRAHLGLEPQRQWSDAAIERTTPCLLSVYVIITLLAHALYPGGQLPVRTTARYPKRHATFADALAAVRHPLWSVESFSPSPCDTDIVEIPKARLERLMQSVCYSH